MIERTMKSKMTSTSRRSALLLIQATVAVSCCTSVLAFAPSTIGRRSSHSQDAAARITAPPSSSSLWAATPSAVSSSTTEYPPLSETKIRQLLDAIPVYAVIDPSQEAIVLLAEKDNLNSLAYLSFSPTHINEVYAPTRAAAAQQDDDSVKWEITSFPLGLVWYDLLQNPDAAMSATNQWVVDQVEYRLLADPQQLREARNLVQQAYQKSSSPSKAEYFGQDYNEIPLFIDDYLRVQDANGNSLVPMYFGLNDLLETCQQANTDTSTAAGSSNSKNNYQASVNLSDLRTVIGQMQQSSPTNFAQAIFIPPSLTTTTSTAAAGKEGNNDDEYQLPTIPTEVESRATKFELPVINQWDD